MILSKIKMEYDVDENNFKIRVRGSEEEVRNFGKCLLGIIQKSLEDKIDEMKLGTEFEDISIGDYQRIYINKRNLFYLPTANSQRSKKAHFGFMKNSYNKAKDIFEKR